MLTWNDPERWYIVLNSPAEGSPVLKSKQSYDSYRKPIIVHGMLYCFDRFNLKILWQRELKDEQIALDQSKTAPVLVQLWKRGSSENSSALQTVLQVTDKLTGKMLAIKPNVELQPYFLLNPDSQQAIVELRLPRETIRIHYAQESPADALEAIQKAGEKPPHD
jgi:hypothetical protein